MRVSRALQHLGIEALWSRGLTGRGVRVGHLDSGVDASHPALRDQLVEYLEVNEEAEVDQTATPTDEEGHGTRTASLLCGGAANGLRLGVAPDAQLCSARVIGQGQVISRVLLGLDWLLDRKVRIVNLSFGFRDASGVFDSMLEAFRRRGILVVAAVGNGGAGRAYSPSMAPGVLSVGASSRRGAATFSGSAHDARSAECTAPLLLAPGHEVACATAGGRIARRSGTSYSTALVSGVAALLAQAAPNSRAPALANAMCSTALPWDRAVHGFVRADAALHALRKHAPGRRRAWPSPRFVDPRLLRRCKNAGRTTPIDLVMIADAHGDRCDDPRGWAGRIVDATARRTKTPLLRARYLPRARAAILRADREWVRALMEQASLRVLSATDVGADLR